VATPPAPAALPPAASKASDNNDLPRTAANGQWVVQISAYRSRESADREVALLKKKGYAAFLLSGGTNFYRVRVGPFRDRSDAHRTAARLTKEGFTPLVTR
jgi:DedD protein